MESDELLKVKPGDVKAEDAQNWVNARKSNNSRPKPEPVDIEPITTHFAQQEIEPRPQKQ